MQDSKKHKGSYIYYEEYYTKKNSLFQDILMIFFI
jgi:hypothetical protein